MKGERVKERNILHTGVPSKLRTYTDEQKEKIKERARVKNSVLVTCPDCMKEMQPAGLKAHIKYRSCKGKPAV